jgi:hypothetical protein
MLFDQEHRYMYKGTVDAAGKPVKFAEGEKYKHVPADAVLAGGGDVPRLHVPGDKDELFWEYDGKGKKGKSWTHANIGECEGWDVVNKILAKEYVEPQN